MEALARKWDVIALVRGESVATAQQRLRERMRGRDLALELAFRSGQLEVVCGDCTLPQFGWEGASWSEMDVLIHCGARTDFVHPKTYSENMASTEAFLEILNQKNFTGRAFYVSSAAVVSSPRGSVIQETSRWCGTENPYLRSKRESEEKIRASGHGVTIVRPSIILSAQASSEFLASGILWCLPVLEQLGAAPINPNSELDLVTSEWVAARFLDALEIPENLLPPLFHLSAGSAGAWKAREVAQAYWGHPQVDFYGSGEWRETHRRNRRLQKAINHYLPFLDASVTYDPSLIAATMVRAGGSWVPSHAPTPWGIAEAIRSARGWLSRRAISEAALRP
jgi:hypothetical protein